jgi:hypothetical protein
MRVASAVPSPPCSGRARNFHTSIGSRSLLMMTLQAES